MAKKIVSLGVTVKIPMFSRRAAERKSRMIDDGQRGWKYEAFSDDVVPNNDQGGYYTFRFGGPLYGVIEPNKNGTWKAWICYEESDEKVKDVVKKADDLEFVKRAVVSAIFDVIEGWRRQLERQEKTA